MLFTLSTARAGQVTYVGPSGKLVAVEHDFPTTWKLNEYACLLPPKDWDSKEAFVPDCGWIILTTRRGAVIKFEKRPDDMEIGRLVERNANPPDKSVRTAENVRRETENKHWSELISFYSRLGEGGNASLGDKDSGGGSEGFDAMNNTITVGLGISPFRPAGLSATSLLPTMKTNPMPSQLQVRISQDDHTDLGVALSFNSVADAGVTGKAIGGFVMYDYYPEKVFHGWWWQGAAGVTQSSNKGVEGDAFSYMSLHGIGTIGYRFGGPPINYGLAAGVHTLFIPTIPGRKMKIVQLLPCFQFDVAWTF